MSMNMRVGPEDIDRSEIQVIGKIIAAPAPGAAKPGGRVPISLFVEWNPIFEQRMRRDPILAMAASDALLIEITERFNRGFLEICDPEVSPMIFGGIKRGGEGEIQCHIAGTPGLADAMNEATAPEEIEDVVGMLRTFVAGIEDMIDTWRKRKAGLNWD